MWPTWRSLGEETARRAKEGKRQGFFSFLHKSGQNPPIAQMKALSYSSAGFFHTQFRVVKMRLKKWRIVSNRHDPPPKCRAAVCGRAGPRGRFLSVLRQFASSLSPRGVYFIIRRPERHERTRRRDGFDAAPSHGQDYFWGENKEFLETFPIWFFLLGTPQCQIYLVLTTPQKYG